MINNENHVERLTRQLACAWRAGHPLDESTAPRLTEPAQAYEVQKRLAQEMAWPLDTPVRAWKVGAASITAQPTAAFLWQHGLSKSPARMPVGPLPFLGIEGEIAVRIASVSALDEPLPRVVIDACCVSIELVSSRFAQGMTLDPLLKLADQGLHEGLVLGAWTHDTSFGWSDVACRLLVDDTVIAQARGNHPCGDPAFALPWLARHAADQGLPLRAGDIVTTGSWLGLVDLPVGSAAEVQFDGIGNAVLERR